MKKIILLLLVSLALFGTDNVNQITWADLKGKMKVYDDPFKKLSEDQIYYLSIYARISQMQKHSPKRVNSAMKNELKSSKEWLVKEGLDVEKLIKQREYIIKMRKKEYSAFNDALTNTKIKMSGYMLPLKLDGTQINEFLLVPTVGACIHTPPPAPNQIVYVKSTEPVEVVSKYEAVTITGVIVTKPSTNNLFLKDGTDDIHSGYILNAQEIVKYKR